VGRYRDMGLIVMYHASEIQGAYVEKQLELGVDIMSVGPEADIAEALAITQGKVALSGNVDPVNVLQNGSPDDVAAETERVMAICKPGGGYVFNSGEMVPRDTPEANMRAMAETVRRLGTY